MKTKWEYSTVICSYSELNTTLEWHGEREWELVSVVCPSEGTHILFFKRQKEE